MLTDRHQESKLVISYLQVKCPHGVVRGKSISDRLHSRLPKAVLPKVQLRERLILPERSRQLDGASRTDLKETARVAQEIVNSQG